MKGNYLNEKVTIISTTDETYEIEFTDGFTEFVPKSDVTILPKQTKRTRIKPSNPKRRKENFKVYYGSVERVKIINAIPCVRCKGLPSENAHTLAKSSGGVWSDIVPLCASCHRLQHQIGKQSFEALYDIDLTELAKEFAKILP
jgi:hypothetical protein